MGVCCSKPRDPQTESDLDRDTIIASLREVAMQLGLRKTTISAVVVGGCVSTVCLRSRATTHDVDYFANLSADDQRALDECIQIAATKDPRLNRHWMNNHTGVFVEQADRDVLLRESIAQNVKVFDEGRLTLYAAPWEYAFIAKLDRLAVRGIPAQPYDMADAIIYLCQYFARQGVRSVPQSEVVRWAGRFGLELEVADCERFNRAYSERFPGSVEAITMDS